MTLVGKKPCPQRTLSLLCQATYSARRAMPFCSTPSTGRDDWVGSRSCEGGRCDLDGDVRPEIGGGTLRSVGGRTITHRGRLARPRGRPLYWILWVMEWPSLKARGCLKESWKNQSSEVGWPSGCGLLCDRENSLASTVWCPTERFLSRRLGWRRGATLRWRCSDGGAAHGWRSNRPDGGATLGWRSDVWMKVCDREISLASTGLERRCDVRMEDDAWMKVQHS